MATHSCLLIHTLLTLRAFQSLRRENDMLRNSKLGSQTIKKAFDEQRNLVISLQVCVCVCVCVCVHLLK